MQANLPVPLRRYPKSFENLILSLTHSLTVESRRDMSLGRQEVDEIATRGMILDFEQRICYFV